MYLSPYRLITLSILFTSLFHSQFFKKMLFYKGLKQVISLPAFILNKINMAG